MLSSPASGRTGLQKIDVTPMLYLQLSQQLKANPSVAFNQQQLQLAFRKYLTENRARLKIGKIGSLEDVHKFALDYVRDQKKILDEQQKRSHASVSQKERDAQKFLEARGLLTTSQEDLPENLRVTETPQEETEHMVEKAELVTGMLDFIASSDPAASVAASLILHAIQSEVSDEISELLMDKYARRADTNEEKDICLLGLENVMDDRARIKLNDNLDELVELESSPTRKLSLLALKPNTADSKTLFSENLSMAEKENYYHEAPVYQHPATTRRYATPFDSHDLSKGPKPPSSEWLRGEKAS